MGCPQGERFSVVEMRDLENWAWFLTALLVFFVAFLGAASLTKVTYCYLKMGCP
jgi:hypothetical protein